MGIQSVSSPNPQPIEETLSDDEIAFKEAMEKGGLTDDERIYFAAHGFSVPQ